MMVKILNEFGDIKTGRQGAAVYQRKYGEQIRRLAAPKRAMPSQVQLAHRELYKTALAWRSGLSRANRNYLEGYCISNWIVDSYKIPLPWSRFSLKLYLQAIKFIPDLVEVQGESLIAEKKDWSDEFRWTGIQFGQIKWQGQTFTPLENYTIGKVILFLWKSANPNLVTVSIRATDGEGKPTGVDLTSGTTDGNTLPLGDPWEWREIELTPYALTQGVVYAICVRAPSATGDNRLRWWRRDDDLNYPRGRQHYSNNSGVTWSGYDADMNFEVWSAEQEGEYTKEGILYVRHPALLSIVHKRGDVTLTGYDNLSSLDNEYLTSQVGLDVEPGDFIQATTLPGITSSFVVS